MRCVFFDPRYLELPVMTWFELTKRRQRLIRLVNFVFKGGDAVCDICAEIPGQWGCP